MRPLVLVHGIASNPRATFGTPGNILRRPKPGGMCSFLIGQGYQPGKTLFWFSYHSLQPVLYSAKCLHREITRIIQVTGCRSVDVLTFSLGGIVGKYLAISPTYQGEIGKMIMIAPPFLGSPKANIYKTTFRKGKSDWLFPGDSRALTPQILGANHPLLLELAGRPFPDEIKTAVIAMRLTFSGRNDWRFRYHRQISAWVGEGDQTVALASTKVDVNRHYVVEDSFAPWKRHGFLPGLKEVQKIVIKELKRDE